MDISMDTSMDISMDIHIHGKPGFDYHFFLTYINSAYQQIYKKTELLP